MGDNTGQITKALAKMLDPEQFIRICMTHYQRGGDTMRKADPRSFVAACVEAAQLGLKPDSILGDCYLIPRWDKNAGGVMVNFQLGYRGLMKLARRGGEVSEIAAEVVYANDEFDVQLGTDRRIIHRPWYILGKSDPGEVIAAYGTAKLSDGTQVFKVVTRRDLDAAAERSGDPRNKDLSNVWRQHFEAMCMKTAITRLGKWLPMPDDSKRALNRDEQREAGVVDGDLRAIIETLGREAHTTTPQPPDHPGSLDDLIPASVVDKDTANDAAGQ